MNSPDRVQPRNLGTRGFWLKALGWVLLGSSVGLVSCQALLVL